MDHILEHNGYYIEKCTDVYDLRQGRYMWSNDLGIVKGYCDTQEECMKEIDEYVWELQWRHAE